MQLKLIGDTGSGTATLYSGDYLIGIVTTPREPADRDRYGRFLSVVAPDGATFPLRPCRTERAAVTAIVAAARSYTYRPHPVAVWRVNGAYRADCPTCRKQGRYARAELAESPAAALADHLRQTGHPAIEAPTPPGRVMPVPEPLPASPPPPAHLYARGPTAGAAQ